MLRRVLEEMSNDFQVLDEAIGTAKEYERVRTTTDVEMTRTKYKDILEILETEANKAQPIISKYEYIRRNRIRSNTHGTTTYWYDEEVGRLLYSIIFE
jgi:aspartyl/asparaginyl-tRNA synthetase